MDIIAEINKLKAERNAVILAHNYQLPEIQDIADYNGDSLGLSIEASKTKADVIVFCGVSFMAETAKIISPNKTVLLPAPDAGCPMADMITAEQLRSLKTKHPNAKVMCYVNSSAEVKAECDLCCTSANASFVANKAFEPTQEVIFVPDKHLANYTAKDTGRTFIIHPGFCPTHNRILPEHVKAARAAHPGAEVLVHPECSLAVIAEADKALSTGGMGSYVPRSTANEFIIGTEEGMIYRLQKDNPTKKFYPLLPGVMVCPNMKKTTLEKVYLSLKEMKHRVEVPVDIAAKARGAIMRMIELSK
jgi:quinolinate synthase